MENNISQTENQIEFLNWKRKTAIFLTSQGISLFGSTLVGFAIIWYITITTSSGIMMTISIATSFVPQIIISIFAGVWADRYNRKTLIIGADAMIAFSTLILAIIFLLGYKQLWLLFTVSAIRSVGAGIQSPAVSAILPQFVPSDKLMKVNGIKGGISSFITVLSPAAGGAILAIFSVEIAFFVDVVTAVIAIFIMLLLRIHAHGKASEIKTETAFSDFKQGIAYVMGNVTIRHLLIYYAFFFFLISPAAFLTPLMVKRSFGPEIWRLTVNEILFSGGAVLGGFLMAYWGGFKNRMLTIALSCAAFGALNILLGASENFMFYLTVMFITGIFMPVFGVAESVLIQEIVENDMQGRVFSMIDVIALSVMPLGMLLFGPIADVVKIEFLLIATGTLMILIGLVIFYNGKKYLNRDLI